MNIKRIGIDLAKHVFQLHGIDEHEKVVLRRQLRRSQMCRYFAQLPPTLIGMEACGSAHYWARTLTQYGHTVKLMAPQFVRPYIKSNKNDANDAEAICEAVSRQTMRFVSIKNTQQQAQQAQQRIRQRLVKARTALINEIHGLLAEFGEALPARGAATLRRELPLMIENAENGLCPAIRQIMVQLMDELIALDDRLSALDKTLAEQARQDERITRLLGIEGIGPISAGAIVAAVGDARQFTSGREFAAWLGMVPRQHSSGGKERLGGISKRGDSYLRTLIIHGARAVVQHSANKSDRRSVWINALVQRRNKNIATVALANKNARIIWAMLTRQETYRAVLH